jgi:RNA polymerase sigma-70 factor (ECF subfamily)
MDSTASFQDVMARLRDGDPQAADRVFHQFAQRLVALARTRLHGRLLQKVDPEDVLQSVYKSFFHRNQQGQWQLDGWDGLWAILTVITLRKCNRCRQQFSAARRDLGREVSVPQTEEGGLLSREPDPEEAAALTETVERLLAGLEGRERDVVELTLQGYSVEEVSERVGRTRRTVQRVLQRVKEQLRQ